MSLLVVFFIIEICMMNTVHDMIYIISLNPSVPQEGLHFVNLLCTFCNSVAWHQFPDKILF